MGEHGVEADDQLTHAGDQGHLGRPSRRDQPGIEAGQHATASAGRRQRCHGQGTASILPPAADLAFAVPLAAVVRVWHNAEQGGSLCPRDLPQLRDQDGQGDHHIQVIAEHSRMAWQRTSGYNAKAGAEGTMRRYKHIIGDTLRSHSRPAQEVETQIAVTVLNRMLDLGRPDSVRAA
jgi:hypothetical protein